MEAVKLQERSLYRVFRAGGREFRIYHEYIPQMGKSYPAYPDFVERPEYTADGRPFALHVQEGCPLGRCREGGGPEPENCGLCRYFCREAADIPIGVCSHEGMRRRDEGGQG